MSSTSTLTIRFFDSDHRGPLHESKVQSMILADGTIALRPLHSGQLPEKAAFVEIWQDDRRLIGGACSIPDNRFDPVPDGMTETEVNAYVTEAFRVATERMERRLQQMVDQLRGDD